MGQSKRTFAGFQYPISNEIREYTGMNDSNSSNWMFYLSIAFWFGVYLIGMHPDVCWGDGMGYALSVDK
ncbi:MAG TPA: hypothetical protein PKY12_13835, partial [Catalimonadaceae bacterium]|nr:hypothetical protein [Catalimonadaceae bacterium]